MPEHKDSEVVALDLQRVNLRLLGFLHQADTEGKHSEDDVDLRALCRSCHEIAGQLVTKLNLLKGGDGHRNWKSIRQALESVWIKTTLDEIAARLQAYRFQLDTRVLLSLRYESASLSTLGYPMSPTLDSIRLLGPLLTQ